MTERKLLTLDDFVTKPTTYTRFGQKVTKNPIQQIYDAGLLSEYKQLTVSYKYLRFSGMFEEGDGGEGVYFQDNSITDDEDIGVIIYIGENKYRRLWGAYVLVDWFYTGDFGMALQRACNYASVRCIPGKTYECNSSITLKLDVKSLGNHGFIDHGHVLIDLRGSTINYTAENTSFCFNIRIYHRDTKFMLTNGTFNVSDSAKITLKNIANVIGGNNYTDMLTDMIYNVEPELQPDTNRVVLVTDPTMEGIKTFNFLNYVGNSISGEDNQAVTKDYDVNIDSRYLKVNDSRIVNEVNFNSIIVTGGNVVLDIIPLIEATININNLDITIIAYTNYSYIVNLTENIVIGGVWNKQSAVDNYYVFKQINTLNFALSTIIVDENDIGIPIYTKVQVNTPITLNGVITEEECESAKQIVENSLITCDISKDPVVDITPKSIVSLFVAPVTDPSLFEGLIEDTSTLRYYGLHFRDTEGVDGYSRPIIPYCIISLVYEDNTGRLCMFFTVIESGNGDYYDGTVYAYNQCNGKIIYHGNDRIVDNIYYTGEIIYPKFYTITAHNFKVASITTTDIQIVTSVISGPQYITTIPVTKIYIKDYNRNEDGSISLTTFYIKNITPVQANLTAFFTAVDTTPTASFIIRVIYNNNNITSTVGDIYIPRLNSRGIHIYEYPSYIYKDKEYDIRYPSLFIYSNNTLVPLQYRVMSPNLRYLLSIGDSTFSKPYNLIGDHKLVVGIKERDGWSCQCWCSQVSSSGCCCSYVIFSEVNTTVKNLLGKIVTPNNDNNGPEARQWTIAIGGGSSYTEQSSGDDTYFSDGTINNPPSGYVYNTASTFGAIFEVLPFNTVTHLCKIYFRKYSSSRIHFSVPNSSCRNIKVYYNKELMLVQYNDIKTYVTTYSYNSKCGKCDHHGKRYDTIAQGVPNIAVVVSEAINKRALFKRIFGNIAILDNFGYSYYSKLTQHTIRDGILKNPFDINERATNINYANCMPIYALS